MKYQEFVTYTDGEQIIYFFDLESIYRINISQVGGHLSYYDIPSIDDISEFDYN